jgi:hypothetical protein
MSWLWIASVREETNTISLSETNKEKNVAQLIAICLT